MSQHKEAASAIMEAIRPRTLPLAVKFLKEGDGFPEKTKRPGRMLKKRVTVCQAMTMARLYGWSVGLAKEDIVCVPALIGFGFSDAGDAAGALGGLFCDVGFAGAPETVAGEVREMSLMERGRITGIRP